MSTATVVSVEEIGEFDDEYVYDIGVASSNPYFFANDILVHNSCYFSAYESLKDDENFKDFEWSKENIIELYSSIKEVVNDSFPEFMHKSFNTGLERGATIKAELELIASRGLFIRKKKYAVLMYYKDGHRLDNDGKPGKIKAMGLDLKRADTPKVMQTFLSKLLMDVLVGRPLDEMYDEIKQFRKVFAKRPGWEKGTPKAVKAMSVFVEAKDNIGKRTVTDRVKKNEKKLFIPPHVKAAINWNKLCDTHGDRFSMRIGDGSKTIMCKLKANSMRMDRVSYPIDEPHLPKWFKELPFDHEEMEMVIIDKKLDNLIGVLKWDLTKTRERPADDFFVFN